MRCKRAMRQASPSATTPAASWLFLSFSVVIYIGLMSLIVKHRLRAHSYHRSGGGILPSTEAKSGTARFTTVNSAGRAISITLPQALSHKAIKKPLVSMHKMLERGYDMTLNANKGTVVTQEGDVIHLVVRNRLWTFPTPTRQIRPTATVSPNPFQLLARKIYALRYCYVLCSLNPSRPCIRVYIFWDCQLLYK